MEYKDLEKVNSELKTTDVKGKDYVEVNQRIKAFRRLIPNGSIETNIESLQDGVVVMSCTVKDETGKVLAKAHAYEKENSTFINKTSFIENCCTSATGRALGYLGIGIDTSIASAEEVTNAINNQNKAIDNAKSKEFQVTISETQINTLQGLFKQINKDKAKAVYDEIMAKYGVTSLDKVKANDFGSMLVDIKRELGE